MRSMLAFVWQLVRRSLQVLVPPQRFRQPAQGLVEYALILVLIAIVVIGAVTISGRKVSSVFVKINCGLGETSNNSSIHGCNNPGNGN